MTDDAEFKLSLELDRRISRALHDCSAHGLTGERLASTIADHFQKRADEYREVVETIRKQDANAASATPKAPPDQA